jgi:hypothetical protein
MRRASSSITVFSDRALTSQMIDQRARLGCVVCGVPFGDFAEQIGRGDRSDGTRSQEALVEQLLAAISAAAGEYPNGPSGATIAKQDPYHLFEL